jgi:hypothetical protein
MFVIAILLLASTMATIVALIVASPLFRTVSLAMDSWADSLQGSVGQPR